MPQVSSEFLQSVLFHGDTDIVTKRVKALAM